jgi:hypothetical protein
MSIKIRPGSIAKGGNPRSSVFVRSHPPAWLSSWLSESADQHERQYTNFRRILL